ncbi:DIS3-like exonuclease 2 isoform X2 [Chironomus tepperi]|uniref:DIS3-like exonuclease 2 isoform X2 n=1 Tax=Chironomus tepperi TaxID=113505 RepID=UPI00391EFCC2
MAKDKNKEKVSDGDELCTDLAKLSISKEPAISTAEFYYYGLDLNAVENLAAINRSPRKSVSPDKKKREKRKKEIKKNDDHRTIDKVKNLDGSFKSMSIAIKNDQSQKAKSPEKSQSQAKNNEDTKATKELIDCLKKLQTGIMTSESVMKLHNVPELKVPKIKKREARNREEILALNKKIQEIANNVKPKLKSIINENPLNGIVVEKPAISESSSSTSIGCPPIIKIKSNKNNKLPIPKTLIKTSNNEVEIYRYSFEQLYQLQQFSTWQMVPKLLKLKICKSHLNELDKFLMSILELPDNERNEAILKKAEERMFIKRKGFNDFTYMPPKFLVSEDKNKSEVKCPNPEEKKQIEQSRFIPSKVSEEKNKSEVKCPNPEEKKQVFKEEKKQIEQSRFIPSKVSEEKNNSEVKCPNPEEKKQVLKEEKKQIEQLRFIPGNYEDVNQRIYEQNVLSLFKNEIRDMDASITSFEDIVKYLLNSKQAYILEGEIRINQRNNKEAYVTHERGMKDVCINMIILRKHAFQGDYVRVVVKRDNSNELKNDPCNKRPEESSAAVLDEPSPDISENRNFGFVLEILEQRHSRRVIGSFAPFLNVNKNRKFLMVIVRDPKVPNVKIDVRTGIPTNIELNERLLLTVEITSWLNDIPEGKVVSILGNKGQLKTENIAILQQNNLNPVPFEQKIIDELPKEPFEIPAKEFEYREDLRKKCIFSIDPESARDLDDALSCESLPNGNLEIGVHISDVSYFVKENSDLDNIVKEKATTIYLVDTVYHMLPEQLCFLCSLLPGSDKLAYSVFFEMDPETAEIFNTRYTRSIVNSCGKLSYDHAQAVIEKKDKNWDDLKADFPVIYNGFTVADVAEVIVKLQNLAVVMRSNRKANGALKIDQPKLYFKFEKDDQRMETPVDFANYIQKDSNRLIEEFMLLANIYVAKFIYEKFPDISLLRQHDAPNENALNKLIKILNKQKIQFDTSSSAALSKSIENLVASARYPNAMRTSINQMVSKTMTRARYFCSSMAKNPDAFWHYALSTPIYTHFTSPIRRYADILVHRVLNAALNYEPVPSRTPDEVQKLANICNIQKYNAKLAGDDSSNLYLIHFIKALQSKLMTACIVGIYEFNFEIVLLDTGHVIKVYYKNLQESDGIIIQVFKDRSPPSVRILLPKFRQMIKYTFGMELLAKVEVVNEKLVVNKILYNKKLPGRVID